MSARPDPDPLVIRFSDGGSFLLATRSPSAYLLDPAFLQFSFLATLVFALLVRPVVLGIDTPAQITFVWSLVFTSNLIWIGFSSSMLRWLVQWGVFRAVYTPIILVPLVFTSHAVFYGFDYFSNTIEPTNYIPSFEMLAKSFFALICFDILHGRFVAPHHPLVLSDIKPQTPYRTMIGGAALLDADTPQRAVQSRTRGAAALSHVSGQRDKVGDRSDKLAAHASDTFLATAIEIGNRKFDPATIQLIRSEEHYLSIEFTNGTKLVRAKLSDATTQLGLSLGYQINRSVWVAYSQISNLRKANGKLELELENGEVISVTRTRQEAFLRSYDLHQEGNDR